MTDETRQVRIHGRVQGVGYREFCVDTARRLGVRGWVRNRRDGTVEALLQGESSRLDTLCERLREGPAFATVHRVDVTPVTEPVVRCEGFDRLSTA